MSRLMKVARVLRKAASLIGDLDALSSLSPSRITRHFVNKWIARKVFGTEARLLFWRRRN